MSITSQKKDVFEQISVLKTASELSLNNIKTKNDIFSAFASNKVKNNKDPFLFIVDLLTILAGSVAVNLIITECFSSLGKVENSYKNSLKTEIMSANGGVNANPPLPGNLISGSQIHINKIDYNQSLFTPDGTPQQEMYLDDFQKNLVTSMKTPNTPVQLNSSITASYNNTNGFFTIKPINPNQSYNSFMGGLIDNVKFINPKTLLNQTMDSVFNTQNKTKTQVQLDAQLDLLLNKLMTETQEDDSYYTFNTQELNDIEKKVNMSDQLYTEVGCGRVAVNMSVSDVQSVTSGVTFPVSNSAINIALVNAANRITNNSQSPNLQQSDKQSVANNFNSSFMNALKNNIVKGFLASPQINMIYAISQSFTTNNDNTFDPLGDIQKRRALTKCMINKLINELLSSLFELIKKEILLIVADVAILYAQEGIEKYKLIIQSFL